LGGLRGRLRAVIFGVATKAGLSPEDAQDVTQETLIAVARRIPGFDPDPARVRSRPGCWPSRGRASRIAFAGGSGNGSPTRPHRPTAPQTTWLARLPDPDALRIEDLYEAEWRETIYQVARERVRERTSPQQYRIFDLHVLHERPVAQVAGRAAGDTQPGVCGQTPHWEAIAREVARLERGELGARGD